MKRKFSARWCVVALLFAWPWQAGGETAPTGETITLSDIKGWAAKFDGHIQNATIEEEDAPKEALFRRFGTRTFTAFKKHPELVSALRKLNPKFDPQTMATSDLNSIVTVKGRTLLVLQGCFPHNCGGTQQVVALEPATNRVYLVQPTNLGPDTEPSGKFYVYGNPDDTVRAALCVLANPE